jgi:hypothetical protein
VRDLDAVFNDGSTGSLLSLYLAGAEIGHWEGSAAGPWLYQWRGRQVAASGESIGVGCAAGCVAFAVSGYLLST